MPIEVLYVGRARKGLANLDPPDRRRIDAALRRFAEQDFGDVKKLQDRPGEYRLRVGKWRAIFRFRRPVALEVFAIDNRGEAY